MTAKPKYPRRKVVSSFSWGDFFKCTLTCGHITSDYGRAPAPFRAKEAPKTIACRQCGPIK